MACLALTGSRACPQIETAEHPVANDRPAPSDVPASGQIEADFESRLHPYRFYTPPLAPVLLEPSGIQPLEGHSRPAVGQPPPEPFWGTRLLDAVMVIGIPIVGLTASVVLFRAIRKERREELARRQALRHVIDHQPPAGRHDTRHR